MRSGQEGTLKETGILELMVGVLDKNVAQSVSNF